MPVSGGAETCKPGSPALLLVPTEMEASLLAPHLPPGLPRAICGVGPVVAGITATRFMAACSPGQVILAGIAGTLDPTRLRVGAATTFGRVFLDGVGVDTGSLTRGVEPLVLPPGATREAPDAGGGEELSLAGGGPDLLTVTGASGCSEVASRRCIRHPTCVAEDMEGYAVALAARAAGCPLFIVRGISNVVGDRRKDTWAAGPALESAATLVMRVLGQGEA